LVVPYSVDSIAIFYQQPAGGGTGYFSVATGKAPHMVEIGDLNNDSVNDIAVSNWNDLVVSIFFNDTVLHAFRRKDLPSPQGGWSDIAIADMNQDQLNDLILMNGQNASGVFIYNQTSNEQFAQSQIINYCCANGENPTAIAVGHLNQDVKTDLVSTRSGNQPSAAIKIYLNQNQIMNQSQLILSYDSPDAIQVADMNCDGGNDIIMAHPGADKVSVFGNDQTGNFNQYSLFKTWMGTHTTPQGLVIADFTGDHIPDIVYAADFFGFGLLENVSAGTSLQNPEYTQSAILFPPSLSADSIFLQTTTVNFKSDTIGITVYNKYDTLSNTTTLISIYEQVDTIRVFTKRVCSVIERDTIIYPGMSKVISQTTNIVTQLIGSKTDTVQLPKPISALRCTVAPNPGVHEFIIELNQSLSSITKLELFDLKGRVIGIQPGFFYQLSDNSLKLNMDNLAVGAYYFRAVSTIESTTCPLIKITLD
jgi:FG-GAP-like repeat